jgi:hypothetical protein
VPLLAERRDGERSPGYTLVMVAAVATFLLAVATVVGASRALSLQSGKGPSERSSPTLPLVVIVGALAMLAASVWVLLELAGAIVGSD